MSELVRAEGLVKEFPVKLGLFERAPRGEGKPAVHAVDGLDFSIAKGEVLALAGESGSGKSTTGRLLLRLIEPTAGKVFFGGTDLSALDAEALRRSRARMQAIFQDPNGSLSPRMTVGDAISKPLAIHSSLSAAERKDVTIALMERIGLAPAPFLYRKYPHQLSGGQCQRVVIARAIITKPEFIVADEPIAMADVSVRALVMEMLKELKEEMGLTYLFITHDLATAKYLSDRIAVMYLGRIVELAPKDVLFRSPAHPYTKALLKAVPVPDPARRRREEVARGEIPSAIRPPSGCHFHPRCPIAVPECSLARPPLREIGPGRFSACILS